jgi:hypothetical protein
MLARPTATTDLTGLRVECLSALGPGMAGDAVGAGVVGVMDTMVVGAGATDAGSSAGVALSVDAGSSARADMGVVRLAGSTGRLAVGFMVALSPTVVEGSTVAVLDTAVAVDTVAVADTGNRGGSGVL